MHYALLTVLVDKVRLNMKKLYWVLIAIVIAVALAEGYALYQIPKSETIKGVLNYDSSIEIKPGTSFKLSLESREQGESKFAILAASESNDFTQFPQHFSLPVLSKSLANVGIYQLRVKVTHQQNVLFVNKGLLPLTRADLKQPLNIDLQIPVIPRAKIIITPSVAPTAIVEEIIQPTPMPILLDVDKLLANKRWLLQTKESSEAYIIFDMKKQYAFGSGGCNKFQGGYQVDQSTIVFNQFIASSKYCEQLMEVETYFLSALPKVTNWLVKEEGKTLYFYDDNKQLLLQFSAK